MKETRKRRTKAKLELDNPEQHDELMRELLGEDSSHLPLMYQLARTVWSFKLAYEKSLGFRGPQAWIMLLIAKRDPEVGLTQSELTKFMKVDASAITRMVKTMETEEGLITRKPDPEDNRLTRVYLTDKGRKAIMGLPERAHSVEQRITANLSGEQLDQLREILTILQTTAKEEYEKARRDLNQSPDMEEIL